MLKTAVQITFVVAFLLSLVLGAWVLVLNLLGRPEGWLAVALSITLFSLNLLQFRPALVPRPTELASKSGDASMSTPRWWNWPARVLVVLVWLTRGGLAAFGAYYLGHVVDRGFNLTLLLVALSLRLLALLRRAGHQLAGFRLDWSDYRGRAGLGWLIFNVLTVLGAGYAFVLSDLAVAYVPVVPRFGYRLLDGWWHVPWLNVSLIVVACVLLAAVLLYAFGYARYLIAVAMGKEQDYVMDLYVKTGVVRRPDPRQQWQFGDE